ncbi:hypothetical protein M768_10430 [Cellulosimicrobium cellulans F16]|uniref:Uncharacterized protein n=1 Tax=Cellulosimicrobium cellulans F16 TaxID=1350482 RepID=A0A0M0F791_CELCE|nr:hypothetical protein M768_10430 [Cellulosimicrobium cellulans F16]
MGGRPEEDDVLDPSETDGQPAVRRDVRPHGHGA